MWRKSEERRRDSSADKWRKKNDEESEKIKSVSVSMEKK